MCVLQYWALLIIVIVHQRRVRVAEVPSCAGMVDECQKHTDELNEHHMDEKS